MMNLIAASTLLALSQGGVVQAGPSAGLPPPPETHEVPAYRAATACGPDGCLSAVEAVTYASYVAPRAGIAGIVSMRVRNIGYEKGVYYLNSEADYRDRNNLTVTIEARDMSSLLPDLSPDEIQQRLMGRDIYARGVARRVRIDFLTDNKPTGKYYYQVQMRLLGASDLRSDGMLLRSKKPRAIHSLYWR